MLLQLLLIGLGAHDRPDVHDITPSIYRDIRRQFHLFLSLLSLRIVVGSNSFRGNIILVPCVVCAILFRFPVFPANLWVVQYASRE